MTAKSPDPGAPQGALCSADDSTGAGDVFSGKDMDKLPAILWFPGDWRKDAAVQSLDYETRGIWFEILMLMHELPAKGQWSLDGKSPMPVDSGARLLGLTPELYKQMLGKLLASGVAKINPDSGILYNGRMVRDNDLREKRARAGRLGGKQKASKHASKRGSKPLATLENETEYEDRSTGGTGDLAKELPETLKTPQFEAAWMEWIAYKRERSEKYKPRGRKAQLTRLAAMGPPRAIAAIHFSMAQGWKGIYEESNNGSQNRQGFNGNADPARVRSPGRYAGRNGEDIES